MQAVDPLLSPRDRKEVRRAAPSGLGMYYGAVCSISTRGRVWTADLDMSSRMPPLNVVTALIGIATSFRPHRCPS